MSDGDLVRQVLEGRTEAYEELVRRWARRVTALCHAKVRSADAAEDLAQDALLRGYRSLASLARPDKFGPWLCTIALHACQNWLQARERSTIPFSALGPGQNPEFLMNNLRHPNEPDSEREEQLAQLRAAVATLPDEVREVLTLYYQGDVTYRDLGQMLGVSPATVNARLTRARMLLRERLGVPQR
jgi:RNA polymerase sigma-70 factor (ECF subfamily)